MTLGLTSPGTHVTLMLISPGTHVIIAWQVIHSMWQSAGLASMLAEYQELLRTRIVDLADEAPAKEEAAAAEARVAVEQLEQALLVLEKEGGAVRGAIARTAHTGAICSSSALYSSLSPLTLAPSLVPRCARHAIAKPLLSGPRLIGPV